MSLPPLLIAPHSSPIQAFVKLKVPSQLLLALQHTYLFVHQHDLPTTAPPPLKIPLLCRRTRPSCVPTETAQEATARRIQAEREAAYWAQQERIARQRAAAAAQARSRGPCAGAFVPTFVTEGEMPRFVIHPGWSW
ncbi:hypothetical protein BCR44DRAFT_1027421 [Catenaria anguillulae PL171]|uniref:Uncharacterized protein n=1 Tax=Catenaria anguillulae PL171 TaxID=765915 RepID=A0A1Y2HV85_9FUNG|nr:hypothetical protein BCR44DRAFT_1027421 [Catenaria anguillulae PL171]